METVRIEALPDEIRSRVMAATANANHRRVHELHEPDGSRTIYAIEAVSGDRLTLMRLSLRPDGSVEEDTDSVTARDIVELDADAAELTLRGPGGTHVVHVAPDTVEAVRAIRT